MKILVISQYYYPEPFKIHEICKELVRRNHEVVVVTMKPNYPEGSLYKGYKNIDTECMNGIKIYRINAHLRGNTKVSLIYNYLDFPLKAWNKIKKWDKKFDIVYCYQLSPVFMLYPAVKYSKKNHIPLITYTLDLWPESLCSIGFPSTSLVQKFIKIPTNFLLRKSDKILVTTNNFHNYLNKVNNIELNKIATLYQHGEDIFFDIQQKRYEDDKIIITFAGNVGKVQGLNYLIEVLKNVDLEIRKNIKFQIIGDGSYKKELIALVNKNKLDDVVKFVNRKKTNELRKYYENTDILFISLEDNGFLSETIPSKFQTYLSVGRPILGSISGETKDIINSNCLGKCGNPGNLDELLNNLLYLLENKQKWNEMSLNAKKYYSKHFTLKEHVNQLEKYMEELK